MESFYVGSTYDLERRISEHNEGLGAAYTRRRRPVTLRWSEHYERVEDAYAAEKRLQGWGRRKRQALIDGEFDLTPPALISQLGRSKGEGRTLSCHGFVTGLTALLNQR